MPKSSTQPAYRKDLVNLYRRALVHGVPPGEIDKQVDQYMARRTVNSTVEAAEDGQREERLKKQLPLFIRLGAIVLPMAFMSVGLYLVGSAVFPIISYYVSADTNLESAVLTAPVPDEQVMEITPLVVTQTAQASDEQQATEPIIINEALDYTNLSNWFGEGTQSTLLAGEVETDSYIIDIPELDIENAEVTIGGVNLDESLIAYPGTALPGELGAPVIFGHSVLRQFYNPSEKNPRRYNSIFSYIMTLEPGDKIYVTYEGVKYTYLVQDKTEVKPEDVYILRQQHDSRLLKLVTCTPEGTYLRRGVVTAQLVQE